MKTTVSLKNNSKLETYNILKKKKTRNTSRITRQDASIIKTTTLTKYDIKIKMDPANLISSLNSSN